MDEAEREEILRTAFENIAKRDDDADELAARRLENLGRVDHEDAGERFERRRAARPPKPEPKLDTAPPNLDERIAAHVAPALSAERERTGAVLAELIAAERKDAADGLASEVRALRIELAALQACVDELRGVVAAEAARTVDLPRLPLRRDLN